MLNFTLPRDIKEAARIERAKIYEEERKKRIFNSRNRLIGVDISGLEKQIAEKKAQEEEEKAKEEAFRLKELRDLEIGERLKKEIETKRRNLDSEINEYRTLYQRKEHRREFDLNDPDILKKSLPCRISDDDPRITISSAQKFEGEDINSKKRHDYQVEQQKSWLQQQMEERLLAEREKKQAEDAYVETIKARDQRAKELEHLEIECKKQVEEATNRFNQALAAEQATRRRMNEMRDLEDQRAEIYNAITGDFLTENPSVSKSILGPTRIVGSQYKGMPPEIRESIRIEQLKQIEENKKKKEEEKKLEGVWNDLSSSIAKRVAMTDEEIMKKQRALNLQMREQNRTLSLEQKRLKDLTEKYIKTDPVTEEFFNQFNKTTR